MLLKEVGFFHALHIQSTQETFERSWDDCEDTVCQNLTSENQITGNCTKKNAPLENHPVFMDRVHCTDVLSRDDDCYR